MIKLIAFWFLTLAALAAELRVDRDHYWMDWPKGSDLVLEGRELSVQWDWPEGIRTNAVHFRLYMKPTPPTNSIQLPPAPPGMAAPATNAATNAATLDGSEIIWQTFIRTNNAFTFTGTVEAALPAGTNALKLTAYLPWLDMESDPSNTLIVRVLTNSVAPVGGPALRIGRWENFIALEFGTNSLGYAERIGFEPQQTAAHRYLIIDPNVPESSGFFFVTNNTPLTPPGD